MEKYWPILRLRKGHCIWPYSTRIRFHSRQRNLMHSYRSIDDNARTFKRISVHASITGNHPNYHSKSPSHPVKHHPHNHLHIVFASLSITLHLMRKRLISLDILISSSHLVISFGSTLRSHAIRFSLSHISFLIIIFHTTQSSHLFRYNTFSQLDAVAINLRIS